MIFIMKRTSYKKDFQSWKGIAALKLLRCNIVAGRFDWKKYAAMTEGGLAMKLFRERRIGVFNILTFNNMSFPEFLQILCKNQSPYNKSS